MSCITLDSNISRKQWRGVLFPCPGRLPPSLIKNKELEKDHSRCTKNLIIGNSYQFMWILQPQKKIKWYKGLVLAKQNNKVLVKWNVGLTTTWYKF